MNHTVRVVIITLVSFGAHFFLEDLYFADLRGWLDNFIHQIGISHNISYIIFGIPILIGVLVLHGKNQVFESLGLNKSVLMGAGFSLLCTLPMFIGFAIVSDLNTELSLTTILATVVAAGFFEELYFRGFLFGQLYRYSRLGFILSVFLGALLFGLVHLYQGSSAGELVGIFLVTFMGGILFAWVYIEWKANLWVPIFLHMFMNLSWAMFSISDNALGGAYANVFRGITIALVIILTIVRKRKRGIPLEVNRRTILMKDKNWHPNLSEEI